MRSKQTLPDMARWRSAISSRVDLAASTRERLRHFHRWMAPGCALYSQDRHLPLLLAVFEDRAFWRSELGVDPPSCRGCLADESDKADQRPSRPSPRGVCGIMMRSNPIRFHLRSRTARRAYRTPFRAPAAEWPRDRRLRAVGNAVLQLRSRRSLSITQWSCASSALFATAQCRGERSRSARATETGCQFRPPSAIREQRAGPLHERIRPDASKQADCRTYDPIDTVD
jgi:hypothetical protein